jgi:polyisoprenoid-binding protein YceI
MRNNLPCLLATLAVTLAPAVVAAADYTIDRSHSSIQFRISHLGYSTTVGGFNEFSGSFTWDSSDPAGASVRLAIDPASIDTNWPKRDEHLRSADFLDVERFPEASFVSTAWEGDAKGGLLKGDLTLHGVTRPINIEVKSIGEGPDRWDGYRAGFSGSTELRRADFGISYDLGPAAETMQFDLFLEGVRQ